MKKIFQKLKAFFIIFRKIKIANYLILAAFACINVFNYCFYANISKSKVEALGKTAALLAKETNSGYVNLSFVNKEGVTEEEFKEIAQYAYKRTYSNVNTFDYDTRMTLNSNQECNPITIDNLGSNYTGIICKNMAADDVGDYFVNYQTGLYFMFKKTGSTQLPDGSTANYIYIRESDADNLIGSGIALNYDDLLTKTLNVSIKIDNEIKTSIWKIQNIILEDVNDKAKAADKRLTELYGNYYLSSIYGMNVFNGFSVDFELSSKSVSNTRMINSALSQFGKGGYTLLFNDKNINDKKGYLKQASDLIHDLFKDDINQTFVLIFSYVLAVIYCVVIYFYFSKVPSYTSHNIFAYIVGFSLPYFVFMLIGKLASVSMIKYFSTSSILINILLTISAIGFMLVAKMDKKDVLNPDKQLVNSKGNNNE